MNILLSVINLTLELIYSSYIAPFGSNLLIIDYRIENFREQKIYLSWILNSTSDIKDLIHSF